MRATYSLKPSTVGLLRNTCPAADPCATGRSWLNFNAAGSSSVTGIRLPGTGRPLIGSFNCSALWSGLAGLAACNRAEKSPFKLAGVGTNCETPFCVTHLRALIAEEEERTVVAVVAGKSHRAANGPSILIPLQLIPHRREIVSCVENCIAHKLESVTMQVVGAGLGYDIHHSAGASPVLGGVIG